MPTYLHVLTEARKFGIALATLLTALLAANLVPEEYAGYAATAVGLLGSLGIYAAPNVGRAEGDPDHGTERELPEDDA